MENPEPNDLWFDIAVGVFAGGLFLIATVKTGEILLDLLVELIRWVWV